MSKGKEPKPDSLKTNENPVSGQKTTDTLSTVDKGWDFVKQGETAQIGH